MSYLKIIKEYYVLVLKVLNNLTNMFNYYFYYSSIQYYPLPKWLYKNFEELLVLQQLFLRKIYLYKTVL